MKRAALTANLAQGGLQAIELKAIAGTGSTNGSIIVLPFGARVIGAYATAESENAFWANPEFSIPAGVKSIAASSAFVSGGDRQWIAPELGLFFKDTKATGADAGAIDPGHWVVAARDGSHSVKLKQLVETPYYLLPGTKVRIGLEREIKMVSSPFSFSPNALPELARTQFVGYEVKTRFELLAAPKDDLYLGPWFLIQLPAPGYAYVPTCGKAVTTEYYEPTGPSHVQVHDNYVRFRFDGIERHKIGVRKSEATGRIAYLQDADKSAGQGGLSHLVIRNFLNNPSGHYADVPLHTPSGTQDSVQFYNHLGGADTFGEIEFHAPGVCRAMTEPVVFDVNQVWIFAGLRNDLAAIASRLLGLPIQAFA